MVKQIVDNVEFSLVMPCYKCEKYIKKAIDSIRSQDFEDWELICVLNGQWGKRPYTKKIIEKYVKKDPRIKLLEIEEGNACLARNKGAEISRGKYISFFSSDFYMFAGCLRKWKQNFDENPTADFVYGGYQLMQEGNLAQSYVYSKPFDAWELQFGNYIDGGFPVKKKVWEAVRWDEKVKSLNDWDWWLGITKAGFVGHYFLDVTYAAEVPRVEGLSVDSHKNWLEREAQIRKKHKIPAQRICVCSLGAVPHGKTVAKILGADFRMFPQIIPDENNFKPHKYDMVYLIGYYLGRDGSSAITHSKVFDRKPAQKKNFKKIIHWIGSDVMQMIWAGHQATYFQMLEFIDGLKLVKNLTEFDQTQGELRSLGLESTIVPFPVEDKFTKTPLPKKFSVAIYTPASINAEKVYNLALMKDIIKSCPDINFVLFGGGLKDLKAKNVENLGWTDMQKVIDKSSCILRFTVHDGMPITPIEFKFAGRDAVCSVQIPYMYFAGTGLVNDESFAKKKEGVISTLRDVMKNQKRKKYFANESRKGIKFWKDLTSPEKFKKTIYKILNEKDS